MFRHAARAFTNRRPVIRSIQRRCLSSQHGHKVTPFEVYVSIGCIHTVGIFIYIVPETSPIYALIESIAWGYVWPLTDLILLLSR
jgi:hypothetical protein